MLREGAVRKDLEGSVELLRSGLETRKFVLCSDGPDPEELLNEGYMNAIVRKAISLGVDPIKAIQMVTLNVAQHFHLDRWMGGIAPSKFADLVLLDGLREMSVRHVICKGRWIWQDGSRAIEPRTYELDPSLKETIRLTKAFVPEDFMIKTKGDGLQRVIAMEMETDLVTKKGVLDLPSKEGGLSVDPGLGLNLVAAIERLRHPHRVFNGIIRGFGLTKGAFACSAGWDTTDAVVLGSSPEDMALAANRVFELHGGVVVALEGKVIWELALPIVGIMSEMPLEGLARELRRMKEVLGGLGVRFRDPLLSLATLTTSAIPFFRISSEGYRDLKTGKLLGLFCY
jgi:adenine deaminase